MQVAATPGLSVIRGSPRFMMFFTFAVLVATLAARDVIATPISRSPYVVKETHFVPKEWSKQGRSHGGKTIQLQIGLKQGRFDELDRHLYEGKLQRIACLMSSP
jgi:hypothetical protein